VKCRVDFDKVQKRNLELDANLKEWQKYGTDADLQLQSFRDTIQGLYEAQDKLTQERDDLTQEREDLTKQLDALTRQHEIDVISTQTGLEAVKRQIEEYKNRIAQNDAHIAELQMQINKLQQLLSEAGETNQRFNSENADLVKRLEKLNNDYDTLNAQLQARIEDAKAKGENIDDLERTIEELRRQQNEYQTLIGAMGQEIRANEAKNQENFYKTGEEIRTRDQEIKRLRQQEEALRRQFRETFNGLEASHRIELNTITRNHQQDLNDLTDRMGSEFKKQIQELREIHAQQIEDIEARYNRELAECQEEMRKMREEMLAAIARLNDELAESRRETRERENEVNRVMEHYIALIQQTKEEMAVNCDEEIQERENQMDNMEARYLEQIEELEELIRALLRSGDPANREVIERLMKQNDELNSKLKDCSKSDSDLKERIIDSKRREHNKRLTSQSLRSYLDNRGEPITTYNFISAVLDNPGFMQRLEIIRRQLKGKKERNMTEKIIDLVGGNDDTSKIVSVILLSIVTLNNFNDFSLDDVVIGTLDGVLRGRVNTISIKSLVHSFINATVDALDRNHEINNAALIFNLVLNAIASAKDSGSAEFRLIAERHNLLR